MSILYIEPFSGASGDMFLGVLASLAGAHDRLTDLPGRLHLHDGRVEVREVSKNGIVCRQVKVLDLSDKPHAQTDGAHEHGHSHGENRHLSDILGLIEKAGIPDGAKVIAREIFQLIGQAESKIHNVPIEKIHFHEISAVDSIVDIVGTALLLDQLKVKRVYCDPICTGFGTVRTQHGILPVPAPATAELLKGMPAYRGDEAGERLTPTGAAILRFLNPDFSPPPLCTERVAYGPGEKDFVAANVLRISLVTERSAKAGFHIIETNIDDSSSEYLGAAFQSALLDAGATDFHIGHAQMKKGRPGLMLSVLVETRLLDVVSDFILENTTTIGVRTHPVDRRVLERERIVIDTDHGAVAAKQVIAPSGRPRLKIEYDDLWAYGRKAGLSPAEAAIELENRFRTR